MINEKWTSGPWVATRDSSDGELCFISQNSDAEPFPTNWIACCCTGVDQVEYEANAHLIAAAPDLYEAAKKAEIMFRATGNHNMADFMASALYKARGET